MPDPSRLTDFLAFAEELALDAGKVAMEKFTNSPAWRKADGSLLTATDEAIDRMISARVQAHYPDHAVLSEEQVTRYDPQKRYTWVVDPIDGTTNFARNMLIWGTSIALLEEGAPVVGVLNFPMLRECFTAAQGHGAFCNGTAIQSAAKIDLDDQDLLIRDTETWKYLQVDLDAKIRVLGSAAYHWAKIADGTGVGSIEVTTKVWDMAGAYIIVQEAGGLAKRLDGSPLFPLPPTALDYGQITFDGLVAGNEPLWNGIRQGIKLCQPIP